MQDGVNHLQDHVLAYGIVCWKYYFVFWGCFCFFWRNDKKVVFCGNTKGGCIFKRQWKYFVVRWQERGQGYGFLICLWGFSDCFLVVLMLIVLLKIVVDYLRLSSVENVYIKTAESNLFGWGGKWKTILLLAVCFFEDAEWWIETINCILP